MRTILFIVLSTFIAQILKAQQDTLIIKLDDYGQITIMTDQLFSKKGKPLKFDDIYSKFYADFQKVGKSNLTETTFNIRYIYDEHDVLDRSIKFEERKIQFKEFYFQDSLQLDIKPFNYILSIKLPEHGSVEIQIAINNITDFDKIAQLNIDNLYKVSKEDILTHNLYKRMAYKIYYQAENNKLDFKNIIIKKDKSYDMISLNSSFGMSIINSYFVPEIDFNIDFILSKKSKLKNIFGINTTFLFIQDENDFFKVYTYNIANISYHLFVRDNSSHKLSVGYMYRKTGPHFNGDTWTASWQYNLKHIGVKLGGYYTKNLEGNYVVIPSIGVNFGF